jgi:AtzE family amidohydrolase
VTSGTYDIGVGETADAAVAGKLSANAIVESALSRIASADPALNAFTALTAERARQRASDLDFRRASKVKLGSLAGTMFGVKNLFDVAGLTTLAGSKINRANPPALADATLIRFLEAQDAILLGALNMGEYAYDFTGENAHYGPSRNPHDPAHMSGGSSGGSASAVAAGMVQFSLASDTNGSIRVPASFCGLFGLKPTYGRLSRAGTFPFVASFDHLGPLARSCRDLSLVYDALQGADPLDPAQARRANEPTLDVLDQGVRGLRIARAGGYFARGAIGDVYAAVDQVCNALDVTQTVELPEVERARAAAYLITMAEGAALHFDRIRARAADFDPDVRDRLIAGTMVPAAWVTKAQKFRRWYHAAVMRLFSEVDVIIAPAAPCRAPRIGQKKMVLDGVEMAIRPNLGIFTQPISFIGLPVVCVPTWKEGERLPIGVQIIAAPWREDIALRVARTIEQKGIARAPLAAA